MNILISNVHCEVDLNPLAYCHLLCCALLIMAVQWNM